MPTIECDVAEARERLANAGVDVADGNTPHERWRATRDGATAVAYEGKVVVQGSNPSAVTSVLAGDRGGRVHAYFDGASRGNPGPAAVGWVLVSGDGIVDDGGETIGRATNNQAEYEALTKVLEMASQYGFDEVEAKGDSQLIVKQVKGAWKTNDPELREKRIRVRQLLDEFEEWSLTHVPREVNERADDLANEALDDA